MQTASDEVTQHATEMHQQLVDSLKHLQRYRQLNTSDTSDNGARRAEILIDLGIAEVKGIIEDGVLINGFEAINNMDLVDWFRKHGAQKKQCSIRSSPWFLRLYLRL